MKTLGKVGFIGRFRPLHIGGAIALEILCEQANQVLIGIGSSNKYNARNPFTPEETKDMIDAVLQKNHSNYEVLFVPDFGHEEQYKDGQRWKEYVVEHFGKLDAFICGNPYVADLLKDDYRIIHPAELIPKEKQTMMRGTIARLEMALGDGWIRCVPSEVADYISQKRLDERLRKEFGLEILSRLPELYVLNEESIAEEKVHTHER